jgi:transcription elongation factor Elf1
MDFPEELKQKINDRLKSMFFLCVNCDSPNPLSLSVIEFKTEGGEKYFTAFAICPNCNYKFNIRIQEFGKVK